MAEKSEPIVFNISETEFKINYPENVSSKLKVTQSHGAENGNLRTTNICYRGCEDEKSSSSSYCDNRQGPTRINPKALKKEIDQSGRDLDKLIARNLVKARDFSAKAAKATVKTAKANENAHNYTTIPKSAKYDLDNTQTPKKTNVGQIMYKNDRSSPKKSYLLAPMPSTGHSR